MCDVHRDVSSGANKSFTTVHGEIIVQAAPSAHRCDSAPLGMRGQCFPSLASLRALSCALSLHRLGCTEEQICWRVDSGEARKSTRVKHMVHSARVQRQFVSAQM